MAITCENGLFYKDGKPHFLLSGEIHYFRLSPSVWRRHLTLLKESGANTVSTYIPWDWHEAGEGEFDFDGSTDPARNLTGFIGLCKEVGLDLIVKPGPYILAEYENQGLPGWLLRKLGKNAFALDEDGRIIAQDVVTYLSDEFLRYVFRWFDNVMPVVRANQSTCGGPIVMMQVCNEAGIFQWLSGKTDYNETVIELYRKYIKQRFVSIEELNCLYGTNFKDIGEVQPPSGNIRNRKDYAAYYDFHLFFRWYFSLYFDILIDRIRGYGIDVQLTHNIPGWIYGQASEMPMLMGTYAEVMRKRPDIAFGLDHIPEFVSFRNAHSDLACNKIISAMKKDGPVWAAEFQAGTREHHVRNYPGDMRTFYFASLAHGIKGFNYYMFSQGKNPAGKGFFGKTFYFQTPLDCDGNVQPLYHVVKEVGKFINEEKEQLLLSKTDAELCIGLYKPYFYTELVSSQILKQKKLDIGVLDLYIDPRSVREDVLFNGALRGLQTLNINYDICDLDCADMESLLRYKQLWVIAAEFMDAQSQRLLAEYVKQGGHLVIYPAIPTLDEYLRPCTVLADELELVLHRSESALKVEALGIKDVYTLTQTKQVFQADGVNINAFSQSGEACGITKECGKGRITALGFSFGYTSDEHLRLLEKLTGLNNIGRDAEVSNPEIQFIVRKSETCSYLFLINYHNETLSFLADSKEYTLEPFSCAVIKRPR